MNKILIHLAQSGKISLINQIFKIFEASLDNIEFSEIMGFVKELSKEDTILFANENEISIAMWMKTVPTDNRKWRSEFLVECLMRSLAIHHNALSYDFKKLLSLYFSNLVPRWKKMCDDADFEKEHSPLIERMQQAVSVIDTHTERSETGCIVHSTISINPIKLKDVVVEYFDENNIEDSD